MIKSYAPYIFINENTARELIADCIVEYSYEDITIKDGTVAMTSSSCKNQVCVQTGAISQTKDVIVCLPNKILVEIIGDKHKGGGVDVISG